MKNSGGKSRRSSQKSLDKDISEKRHAVQNPSRRHREKLNTVLEELTSLLPLSDDVKRKLDKLSVLKLTVSFFQTQNLVCGKRKLIKSEFTYEETATKKAKTDCINVSELALEAIGGFFIVLSEDGNVFYVSDNVKTYLGYSQTHLMHQEFLSYIHADDIQGLKYCLSRPSSKRIVDLSEESEEEEINEGQQQTIFCNVRCHAGRLSSHVSPFYYKSFKFYGHTKVLSEEGACGKQHGFFALCTPVNKTVNVLKSIKDTVLGYTCKMDESMSNLKVDNRGLKNLHLTEKDLLGLSGYFFFHPEDIGAMTLAHEMLLSHGKVIVTFRILTGKGTWQWVRGKAHSTIGASGKFDGMISENILISNEEGIFYKTLDVKEMTETKNQLSLACFKSASSNSLPSFKDEKSPCNGVSLQICANQGGNLIVTTKGKQPKMRNPCSLDRSRDTDDSSTERPGNFDGQSFSSSSVKEVQSTAVAPPIASTIMANGESIIHEQRRICKNDQCAFSSRRQCSQSHDTKPPIGIKLPEAHGISIQELPSCGKSADRNLSNSMALARQQAKSAASQEDKSVGFHVPSQRSPEGSHLQNACADMSSPGQCPSESTAVLEDFNILQSSDRQMNAGSKFPGHPFGRGNGLNYGLPNLLGFQHINVTKSFNPQREINEVRSHIQPKAVPNCEPSVLGSDTSGVPPMLPSDCLTLTYPRKLGRDVSLGSVSSDPNSVSDLSSQRFDSDSLGELESLQIEDFENLLESGFSDPVVPTLGKGLDSFLQAPFDAPVCENGTTAINQTPRSVQPPFDLPYSVPMQTLGEQGFVAAHQFDAYQKDQMHQRISLFGQTPMMENSEGLLSSDHQTMLNSAPLTSGMRHFSTSELQQPIADNVGQPFSAPSTLHLEGSEMFATSNTPIIQYGEDSWAQHAKHTTLWEKMRNSDSFCNSGLLCSIPDTLFNSIENEHRNCSTFNASQPISQPVNQVPVWGIQGGYKL